MSENEKTDHTIHVINLLTGEIVIGKVSSVDSYMITMEQPLGINFNLAENTTKASFSFRPYAPYMGSVLNLMQTAVVSMSAALDEENDFRKNYERVISGTPDIVTPSKQLILGSQ